jgi:predicted ATPase/DNA-binding CsgD family transcriptional regulator
MEVREGRIGPGMAVLEWGEPTMTDLLTAGPAVPEGTVTFLLTDVERSTVRWEIESDAMAAAMARHEELIAEVIAAHHGARPLEQGEGDSSVAAFARASDAIRAALDAQRRFHAEPWPTTEPLRVRIAVHTGEARLRDERSYFGPAIVRTARLRSLAHGGQVVVSASTHALVDEDLPPGTGLADLGVHRLKDLARPEHVWQLTHPDIEAEFPPLASLDAAAPNNLPVSLSTFVGRFDEIDTVVRLVLDNRLVTLMGPGGAGKTRLAQQVGAELVESFPDGVWWIDLVQAPDAELVPSLISQTLSLPEDRMDRLGGLARRLAGSQALLIFDNCEHVVEASAHAVDAVLTSCSSVSVLATSRSPLSVPGELTWRVPPLACPTSTSAADVDGAGRADAVRLFVDRAARQRSNFRLTEANTGDVVAICARLDGVPLAIELAAARCKLLTPAQVLAGLTDAVGALASGPRTVDARHQTIEQSIEWSHSLLDPDARVVLRRLGIFAAPFTLEAATEVAGGDGIEPTRVLEELEQLLDQSLLQVDDQGTETRFRLLEVVRQFARRQLEAAGELDALAERHAAYFRGRALGLWPLFHEGLGPLLDRTDAEHLDMAMMLDHLTDHATPEEHADVAMACLPAIGVRHTAEATALAERVAERVDPVSLVGGRLHMRLALADPTYPVHVETSVAAAEATGDEDLTAHAHFWSTWGVAGAEPTTAARDAHEASRRRLEEIGEEHFSRTHWTVSALDRGMGRLEDAEPSWQRAAAETTCRRCNSMVWSEGALLALARGDLAAAEAALERAQTFAREVRDAGFSANVRLAEVEVAIYRGTPWPAAAVEADLVLGGPNPLVVGYLSEARAIGNQVDGALEQVDADVEIALTSIDDMWAKRSTLRVRRIAALHALGDVEQARRRLAELEDMAARWEAGPWLLAAITLRDASLALDEGDPTRAEDLAHEALARTADAPRAPLVIEILELLLCIAVERDSATEAARLHGAAGRLRDLHGYRYEIEPERGRRARSVDLGRAALGDEPFNAAVAEGRDLTIDEAIAYARRARGERKRPSHGWDGLTPMERQVADLAIRGLTNAEIAEQLFIGRETVKTHLSSAYAKVGVANRTQLVADAARRGIT